MAIFDGMFGGGVQANGLLNPEQRKQAVAQGLMGLGAQLLAASAPSAQPGGFGRGLASGIQAFTQAQQDAIQNALVMKQYEQQEAELEREREERTQQFLAQQAFQTALNEGDRGAAAQQLAQLGSPQQAFDATFAETAQPYTALSAEEKAALGLPPDVVAERAPNGNIELVYQPRQNPVTNVNVNMPNPVPTASQDRLTGGFATLNALDEMDATVDQTGRVKGQFSAAGAFLGTNEEAIRFKTARNNTLLQSQSLIQGIPSNYDAGLLTNITPDLTISKPENKRRIGYLRNVTKAMIADTLAYYVGTKAPIPQYIIEQAKSVGIDTSKIVPWSGQGDPLQNTIDATQQAIQGLSGGASRDYSAMSIDELSALDANALSAEEAQAAADALEAKLSE